MENQINNPQGERSISTTVGAVILVLISIIILLVVWKFKGDSDSTMNVPVVTSPVKTEKKTEAPATETPAETTASQTTTVTQTPIDFDKELKDLDSASNVVSADDFGDSGLSDANLGL